MTTHNLIIIGAGPAALTAGIYAARAELQPLIIEGHQPGGQLMGTSYIENWPGEKKILGVELMMNMIAHAKELGCTFLSDSVVGTSLKKNPFEVSTKAGKTLFAKSLLIASGSTPRRLGCPGEDTYWGKGVTTCAVCDGALYKNRPVVIVGGGDTAMEDASFMTKFTNNITIVQILDHLTASKAMQKKVINNPSITIIYNSVVKSIQGTNEHVSSITIENSITHESTTLTTDAIFIAIGLKPQTDFVQGQLALDTWGFISVTDKTKTSVPGVFAAGDVVDFRYRQAITAAGSGCMAALDIERYLAQKE